MFRRSIPTSGSRVPFESGARPHVVWVSTMTINSMNSESIAPGKGVLMPPVKVDAAKVKTFENAIAFDRWLGVHHHEEDEVWIRIYKVGDSPPAKEVVDRADRAEARRRQRPKVGEIVAKRSQSTPLLESTIRELKAQLSSSARIAGMERRHCLPCPM
jgi:hypothetical protein